MMNHFGSVVAAYMIIWGFLMFYQFTVARRVSTLHDQIEALKESLERGQRK